MKERKRKVKKDRTYDSEGYTRRAGCLCFKTDREEEVRKQGEDQRFSLCMRSSILEMDYNVPTNTNTT